MRFRELSHLGGRTPAFFLVGAALFALFGTTCSPATQEARAPSSKAARSTRSTSSVSGAREVVSNITRDDYAGSAACEPCHADIYVAWQGSAMHQMTRSIKGAHILAPFDGAVFQFKDDAARLDRIGDDRYVAITSPRYGNKVYRVTKVIGGHHREDFAGVEVEREGSSAKLGSGEELVLPVSYVFKTKAVRYKGYSVMLPERGGLRAGPVWQKTCILCHNTAPYLTSILGALAAPGTRAFQGEIVDPLLPRDKRWTFSITDADAFRRALTHEMDFLHGHPSGDSSDASPSQMAAHAVIATRENFGERHLVEVGIGCESCHGGSKEHVSNPHVHPTFAPQAPFLQVHPSAGHREEPPSRSDLIRRTCARCHQVLFSGYPNTWEGGARARDPGGSNINSGEARDSLLGSCQASCVLCHDPHTRESGGRTAELDAATSGGVGNALCTTCHAKLGEREALRAHARHDPDGAGGRCIACHMPKKNMSLDGTLTRYHRIGSPTDAARVEGDRPIECALCHTDKSVAGLLSDIERLYGKRYDEGRLHALYPDWSRNVLLATLESGKPHEQAVAMELLGQKRVSAAIPLIAQQMVHPYPILRSYAERALASILGSSSPVDLNRDDAHIEGEVRKWIQSR